jgi:hypothetical protein
VEQLACGFGHIPLSSPSLPQARQPIGLEKQNLRILMLTQMIRAPKAISDINEVQAKRVLRIAKGS